MRKIIILSLLVFLTISCKQKQESFEKVVVENTMQTLDSALIQKDTLTLRKLLHDDLSLGHSNGWIENKTDLLQTLVNSGVIYHTIQISETPIIKYKSENILTTRRDIDVEGIVNNTPFSVQLNVLEVWIQNKDAVQLLARQSVNRKK